MRQRAVDEQVALLVHQLRRHGGQPPAMEEVHEERLEDVVAVVAQHHGRAPLLARYAVEVAAAQARAERAVCPPLRHLVGDDGIGVPILDPVRHAHPLKELRQHRGGETGLALVEIAGEQLHRQKPAPLELVQNGEQRVAVLAPRQADQPPRRRRVARMRPRRDHAVFLHRLARLAQDPLAQLAELGGPRRALEERVDVVGAVEHGVGIGVRAPAGKRGVI
jgi:hypothetical protein